MFLSYDATKFYDSSELDSSETIKIDKNNHHSKMSFSLKIKEAEKTGKQINTYIKTVSEDNLVSRVQIRMRKSVIVTNI